MAESAFSHRSLSGAPSRAVFQAALAAVVVLTAVRVAVLSGADYDLFFDEAQYWFWSRDLAAGYFSKPPMIALVIAATTGVCGDGEACVRAGAPLLYGVAAVIAGLLGRRMAGPFAGAAAALMLVSMPGVSFAARLISTDAPLLVFWAAALLFYHRYLQTRSWSDALLLGAAVGLGLMSKYAMIYFGFCLAIHAAVEGQITARLADRRLWAGLGVTVLAVLPNVAWNLQNGAVTLAHTADNARWSALDLHFDNLAEFTGAQIGIIGPAAALVLGLGLWRAGRQLSADQRLLLAFSLPVTLTMCLQAFISRANANWAALSFPAYVVLAAVLLAEWKHRGRWLAAVLATHLLVFAGLTIVDVTVRSWSGAVPRSPFQRVLGWHEAAAEIGALARAHRVGAVVSNSRAVTAQLTYYLRSEPYPVRAWLFPDSPRNHYEQVAPATPATPGPVLLVTRCNLDFAALLPGMRDSGAVTAPISRERQRRLYWALLDGVPDDPPPLADCRS